MGRKSRKYDSHERHVSSKGAKTFSTTDSVPQLEFPIEEGKFDVSNPLVIACGSKKNQEKKKSSDKPVKSKILSKKQKKKLELILRRRQNKDDRATILNELAKYRISKDEMDVIKSAASVVKRKAVSESDSKSCPEKKVKRILPEPDTVVDEDPQNDPSIVKYESELVDALSHDDDDDDDDDEEDSRTIASQSESCVPAVNDVNESKESESKSEKLVKKFVITDDQEPCDLRNTSTRQRAAAEKTVYIELDRDPDMEASRQKLPILAEEQTIVEAIRYNNVVIVCGETGSGKTTQIPQFLYEAGYAVNKKIGITEPRRVAAISMSRRVAEEMNLSNSIVCYHVRYETNQTSETKIKFMTDGILLKEIQEDFLLTSYSVIIIDEAHERSVFSDILIGLLSRIVRLRETKNDPLRLIIMSATLKVESFIDNCRLFAQKPPVLKIGSRQYPVTIHFSKITPDNYLQATFSRVCRIHRSKPAGGILVFLTGRQEVVTLCRKLRKTFSGKASDERNLIEDRDFAKLKLGKHSKKQMIGNLLPKLSLDDFSQSEAVFADEYVSDVEEDGEECEGEEEEDFCVRTNEPLHCVPLYSMLSKEKQDEVFKKPPPGHRLCVIATNIAETSLTIPDIKYVVDSGKVKTKVYDKTTGVSTFLIEWCSKSSADQRAGRAGRTSAGHCFRLFSSAVFTNHFPAFSEPEIRLKPIDDLVLQMKSLGISNIHNFPFPTPPSSESLEASEKRLLQMGALEESKTSVSIRGRKANFITNLGLAMSHFPVSPRYARMFAFAYNDLFPYVIAIVAGLTAQEIFLFVNEKSNDDVDYANQRSKWLGLRRRWSGVGEEHSLGDLMVMLKAIGASEFATGSASFSLKNGISHKTMTEVHRLRRQLTHEVNRLFSLKSSHFVVSPSLKPPDQTTARHLRQIALVAFFDHVARKIDDAESGAVVRKKKRCPYQSTQVEEPVFIDETSVLLDDAPEYVVYQEIHETSKMFMRNVVAIEASWLAVYASQCCTLSKPLQDPAPFYDKNDDCVMAFVSGTFGPYCWPIPVTAIPFPEGEDRFKWFAYFLLQGLVDERFSQFRDHLLSHPRILFKSWIRLQPAMLAIARKLECKNISSHRNLIQEWRSDPLYLCSEFQNWLPESMYQKLSLIFRSNKK